MVAKIKAIIQTGITVILLCGIWQMLEYITYREVQPRVVDDIMVLLLSHLSTELADIQNNSIFYIR